jgi:hypothetical protein
MSLFSTPKASGITFLGKTVTRPSLVDSFGSGRSLVESFGSGLALGERLDRLADGDEHSGFGDERVSGRDEPYQKEVKCVWLSF